MEVSRQFHAPAALIPETGPCYLKNSRLGGPQSRSGLGGEDKKNMFLPGIKPQSSIPSPSHYTIEASEWSISGTDHFSPESPWIWS
jgi:hypothetical protein